jgi:ABC-type branched-subunit amino acid transport system ATPase component
MKKYALIGGPGAGKSHLAAAIEEELIRGDGQCEDCNTPVAIVDDYAAEAGERGDYEISLDGGYMANITVAVERYNRERLAMTAKNKTIISCGTVLESAVYSAMQFERRAKNLTDQTQKTQEAARIEATLKMLALLYMDTFRYTKAYYLPRYLGDSDERWMVFERNLQASFSAFEVQIEPLTVDMDGVDSLEELTKRRIEKIFVPASQA